jgi:hypothetical protein
LAVALLGLACHGISFDNTRWMSCRPGRLPSGARAAAPVPTAILGEAPGRTSARSYKFFRSGAALADSQAFQRITGALRKAECLAYAALTDAPLIPPSPTADATPSALPVTVGTAKIPIDRKRDSYPTFRWSCGDVLMPSMSDDFDITLKHKLESNGDGADGGVSEVRRIELRAGPVNLQRTISGVCLTAGTLCPRIRRSDDQTSPPDTPAFKAKVALAAIKGEMTLAQLC